MADSPEKVAALAKLAELEQKLAGASRDLENWEEHDRNRSDGSAAQDRRHEETGQWIRDRIRDAKAEIQALKAMIATMS